MDTYVNIYQIVYYMDMQFNVCLLYHMYNERGKYCVNRNQLSLAIDK